MKLVRVECFSFSSESKQESGRLHEHVRCDGASIKYGAGVAMNKCRTIGRVRRKIVPETDMMFSPRANYVEGVGTGRVGIVGLWWFWESGDCECVGIVRLWGLWENRDCDSVSWIVKVWWWESVGIVRLWWLWECVDCGDCGSVWIVRVWG